MHKGYILACDTQRAANPLTELSTLIALITAFKVTYGRQREKERQVDWLQLNSGTGRRQYTPTTVIWYNQ
jgi:hypothetical protein